MIGTLTDAGPLVALLSRTDNNHDACRALLPSPAPPMVTTWACLVEAMYLIEGVEGHRGQDDLWFYLDSGALILHETKRAELPRMRDLMRQYKDIPMDLADASLVTAAETLGAESIFSVDSDFYIYRLANSAALEVAPGPYRRR